MVTKKLGYIIFITVFSLLFYTSFADAVPPTPAQINTAIEQGLDYLVATQASDGSWGNLPAGGMPGDPDDPGGNVGLTALCVWAFAGHGVTPNIGGTPRQQALAKGINYLLNHQDTDPVSPTYGAISDGDYSNYKTAISTIALYATHQAAYHPNIIMARDFLKDIQQKNPADWSYGGWGYGPYVEEPPLEGPTVLSNGVDVFIKDNENDMGTVPSQDPFWLSPDIWVTDYDGNPVPLIPGNDCQIHVRVGNLGDQDATNVKVALYYNAATIGAILPNSLVHIGTTTDNANICSGCDYEFYFDWAIPADLPTFVSLGAIVEADNDPATEPYVEQDNNLSMVNVAGVKMPLGDTIEFPFVLENPTEGYSPLVGDNVTFDIEVWLKPDNPEDNPLTMDDLNQWTVELWKGKPDDALYSKITNFVEETPGEPQDPPYRHFALRNIELLIKTVDDYTLQVTSPSGIVDPQQVKLNILQIANFPNVSQDDTQHKIVGGYDLVTVAEPVAAEPELIPVWPHSKIHPGNVWADLSNTQFSIMALSLTQWLDPLEPTLFHATWDDMAQRFVDNCQEPADPEGNGRAHNYQPEDTDIKGSMAYAGIWCNALMPPIATPTTPWLDDWNNRMDSFQWVNSASPAGSVNPSDFHYTVTENYNHGQWVYYYGALSQAKALLMTLFPVITPDGAFHNPYLEFAEELVTSGHAQNVIPGTPTIGYWQNSPSDPYFMEENMDLSTAYALLVLELKSGLLPTCCLHVKLVKTATDPLVQIGLKDNKGREALHDFTNEIVNDIPGVSFEVEDGTGNILLHFCNANGEIEPELYHLILNNTDTASDAGYEVIIELECDENVIFSQTIKSKAPDESVQLADVDMAKYPRIPAAPDDNTPGQLFTPINMANVAGGMPIIGAPTEPSEIDITPTLEPSAITVEQNNQAVTNLNLAVSAATTIEVAFEVGDEVLSNLDTELPKKLIQFSDNPIKIEQGIDPDPVEVSAYAPLSLAPGDYQVEILVKYRDLEGGLTEVKRLLLDIAVTELSGLVPFTGIVTDTDDNPLENMLVQIIDRGVAVAPGGLEFIDRCRPVVIFKALTDVNGRFESIPVQGANIMVNAENGVAPNAYYDVSVTDPDGQYKPVYEEDIPTGDTGVTDRKYELIDRELGDVSGNGEITALDASLILQHSVQLINLTGSALMAADVDHDGDVTPTDASIIMQYVVELIWEFPEPQQSSPSIDISNCLISLPDLVAEAGDSIDVPIRLTAKDVYAGYFALSYDSELLKPLNVSVTEFTKENSVEYKSENGMLKISMAGSESITLEEAILNISFEVLPKAAEGTTTPIKFERASLNDFSGITKKDGSITVNPTATVLHQNYPNPFNPETWIPFKLAKDANVVVTIFDLNGKIVKTIDLGKKQVGSYMTKEKAVYWDGKNELGEHVASGIYFYSLQANNFSCVKKMLIIK